MNCRLLTAAGALLPVLTLSAAEPKPASPAVPMQHSILDVVAAGGVMMYPLALLSVAGVVLILIYMLTIRRSAVVSDRFMSTVEIMLRQRDYRGLLGHAGHQNECMARITQRTLEFVTANQDVSFEGIRDVAQTEGSRQVGMLTSRITYLAEIGAIAPMVGLLGTVIGMIKAFLEIASGQVQGVRQMGLAEGVSEALVATAFGLSISIVALVAYAMFRGRLQKRVSELECATTHFVALLNAQAQRGQASLAQPAAYRAREDYAMPTPLPLGAEQRPDLHGI